VPDQFLTYRECREDGCRMEAEKRKQRCYECWLRAQPPIVRLEAAERRLSLIPEAARRKRVPEKEWPPGRRFCSGCQTFVLVEDATGSRCKACVSVSGHRSRMRSQFGIDENTYQWLLQLQGGRCAICRQRPKSQRLVIDHDHAHCKSGCPKCIRGLLDSRCNHELLGAAHDSIHILRNAVAYLETPPMSGEWSIPEFERQKWAEENPDEPLVPPF
jgi:hypothetical protein